METLSDLRRRIAALRGRRIQAWMTANALIALSRGLTAATRGGRWSGVVSPPNAERLSERARSAWVDYMAERDALKHMMIARLAEPRRSRGWRR